MTIAQLEKRLAALEQTVAALRAKVDHPVAPRGAWSRENAGRFANDPLFEEMVRLGKEYRDSLKPGRRKRKSKK